MEAYYTNDISTQVSLTKNMSNPKPDFFTVIKISISSITKHSQNISHNSKRKTNLCVNYK